MKKGSLASGTKTDLLSLKEATQGGAQWEKGTAMVAQEID